MADARFGGRIYWAGIVLVLVGAVLLVTTFDVLAHLGAFTSPEGEAIAQGLSLIQGFIDRVAIPVGASLIGAGIVIKYCERTFTRAGVQESPRQSAHTDSASSE
jgi:hypothetical protein